ncbi:MAG: hypothetical protein RBU45_17670 [Myxococcota bacterium]|jgi:hypothetical protein|nr:hypothetical protein [Myxococcota bacterium]
MSPRTVRAFPLVPLARWGNAGAAPWPALPVCPTAQDAPDPASLLRRLEYTLEGSSSFLQMSMVIPTPTWSRTLSLHRLPQGK